MTKTSTKIYAVAANMHDHNTYDGVTHIQVERLTRRKHNLMPKEPLSSKPSREFFAKNFMPFVHHPDLTLAFSCSNLGKEYVRDLLLETFEDSSFLTFVPTNLWDNVHTDEYYYIDHHQSHAAYAYLSSGYESADTLAIDGQGCTFSCIFVDRLGNITDLSSELSLGGLWNLLSQHAGLGYLGAGKLMGLAAYGQFNWQAADVIEAYLVTPNHRLTEDQYAILTEVGAKNVACTLQALTTHKVVNTLANRRTSDRLCLGGGVAYNGYLCEALTKVYRDVHVPPAVGDEGQALGTYMHADYVLNGNRHVPSVYAGPEYDLDDCLSLFSDVEWTHVPDIDSVARLAARCIARGGIIGWFQGRSESGNRALGNRSILADPRNQDIKNIINSKIKMREDFRPFAPSVLHEHYLEYFDTNQPSPYMSRIVPVISDAVPGVTHIDGTARVQTVRKEDNERFYSLISEFHKITGVPMVLNTSFNCREPIVETPAQALATFRRTGLDMLVIGNYVVKKGP